MTSIQRDQSTEIKEAIPALMRVAGQDADTAEVLQTARHRGDLPVQFVDDNRITTGDYAKIDLTLDVADEDGEVSGPAPDARLGYAGWTPRQRAQFLSWLRESKGDAPAAFQELYLANLESRLFEGEEWRRLAQTQLLRLEVAPAWRNHQGLARVTMLSFWLTQDAPGLADWLTFESALEGISATLISWGLGWQALLGESLRAPQIV